MSADSWAICPKCRATRIAKRSAGLERARKDVSSGYGKVSPEEYAQLVHVWETLVRTPGVDEECFREDYSVGTHEDGIFSVIYNGECNICKFTVRFKHSEQKTI